MDNRFIRLEGKEAKQALSATHLDILLAGTEPIKGKTRFFAAHRGSIGYMAIAEMGDSDLSVYQINDVSKEHFEEVVASLKQEFSSE